MKCLQVLPMLNQGGVVAVGHKHGRPQQEERVDHDRLEGEALALAVGAGQEDAGAVLEGRPAAPTLGVPFGDAHLQVPMQRM